MVTKTQQDIIDRLKAGWSISAPTHECMTEWVKPNGRATGYACAYPSLRALEKQGFVCWNNAHWQLVESGALAPAPDSATVLDVTITERLNAAMLELNRLYGRICNTDFHEQHEIYHTLIVSLHKIRDDVKRLEGGAQ